ncbi:MAG: ATP-dependent metalloprotease, partial [bacterium]|nr:ATP-dependent metalloprotease [bacterium]
DALGPIDYSTQTQDSYFGLPGQEHSQKTAEIIDTEVKKLIDLAFNAGKEILQANRDKLQAIADALLKYETLDAVEVKTILDGGSLNKPTVGDLLKAEQDKTN